MYQIHITIHISVTLETLEQDQMSLILRSNEPGSKFDKYA